MGLLDTLRGIVSSAYEYFRKSILREEKPQVVPEVSAEERIEELEDEAARARMQTSEGLIDYFNSTIELYQQGKISSEMVEEVGKMVSQSLYDISEQALALARQVEERMLDLRKKRKIVPIEKEQAFYYEVMIIVVLFCKRQGVVRTEFTREFVKAHSRAEVSKIMEEKIAVLLSKYKGSTYVVNNETCVIIGFEYEILRAETSSQRSMLDFRIRNPEF